MENSGWIAITAVIVLVAMGFWYFNSIQNHSTLSETPSQNTSTPIISPSSTSQGAIPLSSHYNDSTALNDLGVIINPMSSVLSGISFLNDSNASNILNQTIADLTSFESNSNLSALTDKNFFISYAGAVVELATANKDYLNFLLIQDNQTVGANLCANKQVYIRSLFFLNKSAGEVLNASAMLNNTLVFSMLASQASTANTTRILQGFSQGFQKEESTLESNLYLRCG